MAVKPKSWARSACFFTAGAVVVALGGAGVGDAGAVTAHTKGHQDRSWHGGRHDFHGRQGTTTAVGKAIPLRAEKASSRQATQALRADLGHQAVVEMDGTTGTPRIVERLDGTLTQRSSAPARTIAMRYVQAHLAALGLT